MSLFNELKRRNVFRVAIAYLAGAWLLTEVAGTLFPAFGIPDWAFRFVVLLFVWSINLTTKLGEQKIEQIHRSIKEDVFDSAKARQENLVVSRWSKLSLVSRDREFSSGLKGVRIPRSEKAAAPGKINEPAVGSGIHTPKTPLETTKEELKSTPRESPVTYSLWRDVTLGAIQ